MSYLTFYLEIAGTIKKDKKWRYNFKYQFHLSIDYLQEATFFGVTTLKIYLSIKKIFFQKIS